MPAARMKHSRATGLIEKHKKREATIFFRSKIHQRLKRNQSWKWSRGHLGSGSDTNISNTFVEEEVAAAAATIKYSFLSELSRKNAPCLELGHQSYKPCNCELKKDGPFPATFSLFSSFLFKVQLVDKA